MRESFVMFFKMDQSFPWAIKIAQQILTNRTVINYIQYFVWWIDRPPRLKNIRVTVNQGAVGRPGNKKKNKTKQKNK